MNDLFIHRHSSHGGSAHRTPQTESFRLTRNTECAHLDTINLFHFEANFVSNYYYNSMYVYLCSFRAILASLKKHRNHHLSR